MKTIYLFLIIPFFLFGCSKDSDPVFFDFGVEENFKIGNENKSAENNLKFTITDVRDSRCPSDVVCIWQGEAEVEIEFFSPFQETIELSTYDDLVDTVGNYKVELLDVLPYPISTKTIKTGDYTIKLKINSLDD